MKYLILCLLLIGCNFEKSPQMRIIEAKPVFEDIIGYFFECPYGYHINTKACDTFEDRGRVSGCLVQCEKN